MPEYKDPQTPEPQVKEWWQEKEEIEAANEKWYQEHPETRPDKQERPEREAMTQEAILKEIGTQAPDLAKQVGQGRLGMAVSKVLGDYATLSGRDINDIPWNDAESRYEFVQKALSDIVNLRPDIWKLFAIPDDEEFVSELGKLAAPPLNQPGANQQTLAMENASYTAPSYGYQRPYYPSYSQPRAPTRRAPFQYRPLRTWGITRI